MLKAPRGRVGQTLPILTGFLFVDCTQMLKSAGRAALGVYVSTADLPVPVGRLTAAARELSRELRSPPPEAVKPWVLQSAQAAELLLEAIGRSDGTRASVVKRLRASEVEDGVIGTFRFDRSGDITPAPIAIMRVTGSTARTEGLQPYVRGAVLDRLVQVPVSLAE